MSEPWSSNAGFNPIPKGAWYYAVPEWLLRVPGLMREAAFTYALLHSFWRRSQRCDPSMGTIASRLGVDRSTAIRQIRHLEELGLIAVHRHREGGRHHRNRYSFLPHPAALDGGAHATKHGRTDATTNGGADATTEVAGANHIGGTGASNSGRADATQVRDQKVRSLKDQNRGAHAPGGSVVDEALSAESLEARYDAVLIGSAREACALASKNARITDAAWVRVLQQLAPLPLGAVNDALDVFIERHAPGSKGAGYLVTIAQGKASNGATNGHKHTRKGPAMASTAEAFEGLKDDFS